MKKAVLKTAAVFLSVIALVVGFSASGANAAHGLPGSALIYTYYDVRPVADGGLGVNDNYFTLVNTSDNWVQAHVRVRTGDKSVELLDFDVMLSPKDVFSWTITDDGEGAAFSSLDKGTISNTKMLAPFLTDFDGDGTLDGILLSTNFVSPYYSGNLTSLIELCQTKTQSEAAALTKKGYVEVIEEGAISHCGPPYNTTGDKNKCAGPNGVCELTGTTDDVTIGSHTLSELWGLDSLQLCRANIVSAGPNLVGRAYYASIDTTVNVLRLAHLDSETMDYDLPNGLILHANTYPTEIASDRCRAGAGNENSCYGYTAASANLQGELNASDWGGADDMNWCFYVDSVLAGTSGELTGILNKFGAAGTFGPTIADLVEQRDGSLGVTRVALDEFSGNSSYGVYADDGVSGAGASPKDFVNSHYLFYPGIPFNITSAWAFIFPVQHFIGEANKLGKFVFYDMDENTITPPTTGFISPGLPGPGAPAQEEAFLETLTSSTPFDEGWLLVGPITATNKTRVDACQPSVVCSGDIPVSTLVRGGAAPYRPGYTGAAFVSGPSALSSSLLQVNGPMD